jgi:hypothetical protein
MPQISIPMTEDGVTAAADELARTDERLEVAQKTNITISYPGRFAEQEDCSAIYRGHRATAKVEDPYFIGIEFDHE